jgi:serine/threonine-protein kinase
MSSERGPDTPPTSDENAVESLVPVAQAERNFGRYLLRYEIASGGMATVYLARVRGPAGFDRPVALKRIHPHLAKKRDFVEMFLDEAKLSARITHPNVCSVFDFGEVNGTYFMAMEYLVGQSLAGILRALVKRDEIASSRRWHAMAARMIADACEGLHAAHELRDETGKPLGVVHRDVTPHNIFVTYDGAVKVVDFGVAWAEARLHHTQTGALKGKLAYMSPEQVRRQDIDRRLDVWALGVCLWELLTVQRLFPKKTEVELLQAVTDDPIVPPSQVRPGIPAILDDIVMRALQRDLDLRYPSARALGRELNAFVSGSGVGTGLADLGELLEELFENERENKLGVVRSVLNTGSEIAAPQSHSGSRRIEMPKLPPDQPEDDAPRPRARRDAPTRPMRVEKPEPPPSAPPDLLSSAPPPPTFPWTALVLTLLFTGAAAAILYGIANRDQLFQETADQAGAEAADDTRPTIATPPVLPPDPSTPVADDDVSERRARGPGSVDLVLPEGETADVWVDGERVGTAPGVVRMTSGRQTIELRSRGQPARRFRIAVPAGTTTRFVVPAAAPTPEPPPSPF